MVLFWEDNKFLAFMDFAEDIVEMGPCTLPSTEELICRRHAGHFAVPAGMTVRSVVLGSTGSSGWIKSISFTVAEPSDRLLLVIGIFGVIASARRHLVGSPLKRKV